MPTKKKINTHNYNQFDAFVSDLTFNEAIQALSNSEKDMPQITSRMVEAYDDEALMRISYAETAALLVFIRTWARGDLSQITIFRGQVKHSQTENSTQQKMTSCAENIGIFLGVILWGAFVVIAFVTLSRLVDNSILFFIGSAIIILIAWLALVLLFYWVVNTGSEDDTRKSKVDTRPAIHRLQRGLFRNNTRYEDLLVTYVKNKLGAKAEDNFSSDTEQAPKKKKHL